MEEELENTQEQALVVAEVNTAPLKQEATEILNKLIAETDPDKAKDLTALFNINQNKKTLARTNKMSDLLDILADQAMNRMTEHPDEISNKELFEGMKTIQSLIEHGQDQVNEQPDTFIQINPTEVNVVNGDALNRDSRERVKNAVLSLLNNLQNTQTSTTEVNFVDKTEDENND